MIDFKTLKRGSVDGNYIENPGFTERLLICIATAFLHNTTGLKLKFYSKLMNFIRLISLYIIEKNDLRNFLYDPPLTAGSPGSDDGRIVNTLLILLYQFKILRAGKSRYVIAKKFMRINDKEREAIFSAVEHDSMITDTAISAVYRRILMDFFFVRDLISRYRNRDHVFRHVSQGTAWSALIEGRGLDYEVRLCETLFHLSKLSIPHKIPSPFDESYYTESGRNAFNNFTRHRFGSIIEELDANAEIHTVLDIGCGYGDYLQVVHTRLEGSALYGIELQQKVFREVQERFIGNGSIKVLNINFFEYRPDFKFDLILLNYVLFYFNYEEKKRLFRQAGSMLSENGSILVCQYFQGIEAMKRELARVQKDLSVAKKIEMYYSNKILYANTLWNDAADTFSESAIWNELIEILDAHGLEVRSLTNADPFYFSLFLEIRRKK